MNRLKKNKQTDRQTGTYHCPNVGVSHSSTCSSIASCIKANTLHGVGVSKSLTTNAIEKIYYLRRFYIQSPIMATPLLWPLTALPEHSAISLFLHMHSNTKITQRTHFLVSEKYWLKAVGILVSLMIVMRQGPGKSEGDICVKLRKNRGIDNSVHDTYVCYEFH